MTNDEFLEKIKQELEDIANNYIFGDESTEDAFEQYKTELIKATRLQYPDHYVEVKSVWWDGVELHCDILMVPKVIKVNFVNE